MVWTGVASVPLACGIALCFGMVMAFSQPVRGALTPMLVPRSSLMHAIVVMTIGSNIAMIAGPLLAGTVIDRWDVGWAFAAQAAFLGAGVVMVTRLRIPDLPPRDGHRDLRTDVKEGLRFVWRHDTLRPLFFLLCVGGGLMMGGATALLPKLARDVFGRSADDASQLFALMGLGMILTSFALIKYRQRLRRRGLVFMLTLVVGCTNQVLMGFMPTFGWLEVLLLLWGVGGGIYLNLNQTLIQESTPQDHMGRVMSLTSLAQAGLMPIGALVGSALAGAVGPRAAMSIFGAIGLVCVLGTLWRADALRARE
jgi:predicted MFS family arabinose efflux permease